MGLSQHRLLRQQRPPPERVASASCTVHAKVGCTRFWPLDTQLADRAVAIASAPLRQSPDAVRSPIPLSLEQTNSFESFSRLEFFKNSGSVALSHILKQKQVKTRLARIRCGRSLANGAIIIHNLHQ